MGQSRRVNKSESEREIEIKRERTALKFERSIRYLNIIHNLNHHEESETKNF